MSQHRQVVDDKADLQEQIQSNCFPEVNIVSHLRRLCLDESSSVTKKTKLRDISGTVCSVFVHQYCRRPFKRDVDEIILSCIHQVTDQATYLLSLDMLSVALE